MIILKSCDSSNNNSNNNDNSNNKQKITKVINTNKYADNQSMSLSVYELSF